MAVKHSAQIAIGWTAVMVLLVSIVYLAWPVLSAKPVSHSGGVGLPGRREWFDQQYLLKNGEFVRFVPPPFLDRSRSNPGSKTSARFGTTSRIWYFDRSSAGPMGDFPEAETLVQVLMGVGGLTRGEFEIPPDLARITVDGDWVVRAHSTPDQRIPQIEQILRACLKRDIHITRWTPAADAIVFRGAWPGQASPQSATEIYLFVGDRQQNQFIAGDSNDLFGFFRHLEHITHRRVVDYTRSKPIHLSWKDGSSIRAIDTDPEKLQMMLDNLCAQTSLRFTFEPRDYPMYVVSDGPETVP